MWCARAVLRTNERTNEAWHRPWAGVEVYMAATSPAERLRGLLADARTSERCLSLPACHDAISAVLVERAGFKAAFMSGYAVSATQLALPDAGLISYGEQLAVGQKICDATSGKLCVIGDGDTGFGGSGNVRRTMRGYAAAGFAGISIEDQVFPKRCSYAKGLAVEPRAAAISRVRAALSARDEMRHAGLDLVLVARTDCRNAAEHGGLEEALARCAAFAALGAEVVYAEGLRDTDEMRALHAALRRSGCFTMLAQVERPGKQLVSRDEAAGLGYSLSLMGLTVLSVAMRAMQRALAKMASGGHPSVAEQLSFDDLYREVGFEEHYDWEARFADEGEVMAAHEAAAVGEKRRR